MRRSYDCIEKAKTDLDMAVHDTDAPTKIFFLREKVKML